MAHALAYSIHMDGLQGWQRVECECGWHSQSRTMAEIIASGAAHVSTIATL